MAQQKIKFDGVVTVQPDDGLGYDFETTYTKDSTRVMSGVGHFTPLFAAEAFSFKASNVTKAQASQLLNIVVARPSKPNFQLYYFSPFYGAWRTDTFYVGKGSLVIGHVIEDSELISSISFNMIGVNPI